MFGCSRNHCSRWIFGAIFFGSEGDTHVGFGQLTCNFVHVVVILGHSGRCNENAVERLGEIAVFGLV